MLPFTFLAVSVASAATAAFLLTIAEGVVSAANDKSFCVDQHVGEFFTRIIVDTLHSRAGNVHLRRAFLLRKAHQIDEANGFIFVHAHYDGALCCALTNRAKRRIPR